MFERQIVDQMTNAWLRCRSPVPMNDVEAGYDRARRITCGVAAAVLR